MSESADIYQATYRRAGLCILGVVFSLLIGIGGVTGSIFSFEEEAMIPGVFAGLLFALAGMAVSLIVCLRRHRWTLGDGVLQIEEGPRVPLTGLSRRVVLPYADIVSVNLIRRGFEEILEITTRTGARHRLTHARGKEISANEVRGIYHFDIEGFHAFAARLDQALGTLGEAGPALRLANHFWTRPGGLALQGGLLLVTLAIAGGVLWALFFGGGSQTTNHNTHRALGVVGLLPVLMVWSIRRSLRHAREVRQQDRGRP